MAKSLRLRAARLIAAVFVALAASLCISVAIEPTQAFAAEAVHAGMSGDNESMNGMTWEEVKEGREHDEDADAEDWEDRCLGGTSYPGFDIANPFIYVRYWLFTLIETFCGLLVDICNGLFGFLGQTDALTLDFNSSTYADVYNAAVSISQTLVQPVAVGFLGMALVIELLNFSKDLLGGKGNTGYEHLGSYVWIIVKASVIATLIGHATLITGAIYEVFLWLTRHIVSLLSAINISGDFFDTFMVGLQEVTYANFGQVFIFWLVAIVMLVVVAITVLRVIVLMVTRMMEIYAMASFAGFPLVMLMSRQTRDSGVRYLKSFASVCFQASILVMLVFFSATVMSGVMDLVDTSGIQPAVAGVLIAALAPIAGCFGINAVIGQSREIAGRILGA